MYILACKHIKDEYSHLDKKWRVQETEMILYKLMSNLGPILSLSNVSC